MAARLGVNVGMDGGVNRVCAAGNNCIGEREMKKKLESPAGKIIYMDTVRKRGACDEICDKIEMKLGTRIPATKENLAKVFRMGIDPKDIAIYVGGKYWDDLYREEVAEKCPAWNRDGPKCTCDYRGKRWLKQQWFPKSVNKK